MDSEAVQDPARNPQVDSMTTRTSLPDYDGPTTLYRRVINFDWKQSPLEPLINQEETLVDECLRRHYERLVHPENVMNRVVYDCNDTAPFTTRETYYTPSSENDITLVFESRFESGNLRRAIQVYTNEYDLILRPDTRSRGYTQWYFFSVANTRANTSIRFNLINLLKTSSLYNCGMQPLMYSVSSGKSWRRVGTDVCYFQSNLQKRSGGNYFTLAFTVEFESDNDTVYFAHNYPYTVTMLTQHIDLISCKTDRLTRKTLCQTEGGNIVELLTITSLSEVESLKSRKGVVLMSRVHPGESNSSWMMKGIIDFLVGPSLEAKILRDNFVFKIIPMLMPDGVMMGSTRCGLSGVDANRCWNDPDSRTLPEIYHAKQMIKRFSEERELVLLVDLHGHSVKKNFFMYGCTSRAGYKEKIFPMIMKQTSKMFSFDDCTFGLQKSKEGTARVELFKELNLLYSYTLEGSFAGSDIGPFSGCHFNTSHLEEIGHNLCDAIYEFFEPSQRRVRSALQELDIPISRPLETSDNEECQGERSTIRKRRLMQRRVVFNENRKRVLSFIS
mmetsp:Transcript_20229/g.37724  ORF Transcript_20229/g.37724 Transcript_20229/m.37724 type:complete len:558 (+) Transcript_20229:867-2540(+)